MNIIMTGVTGFIGSHLAESLVMEGHMIHAIVRRKSKIEELPSLVREKAVFHVYDSGHNLLDIFADICGRWGDIDVVYHLASLYLPRHAYEDIEELVSSNILFGTQLLEAMKQHDVRHLVNAGTSWQHYGNEDYNPVNLYAATKQAFEDVIKYYAETARMRVIHLHLFDTYGPGDKRKKIIALFKKSSHSGAVLKMSPGEQLMDLVHIDDVVSAFRLAGRYLVGKQYEYCGTYGVSSNARLSLRKLAKEYERIAGVKLNIEWGGLPYREREVMLPWNKCDNLPGWIPRVDLESGIKSMV